MTPTAALAQPRERYSKGGVEPFIFGVHAKETSEPTKTFGGNEEHA